MLRTWSCTGLLVALSLPAVYSSAEQATERHVYVTVLGSDGAPVAGLGSEYFAVRESGTDRDVIRVEPLRVPMHVAVLVDTSTSDGLRDEAFRSAVVGFVERLAAFNEVALYAFGDRAASVVPFTQDATRLRAGALNLFGWSHQRSNLIDGIDLALADLGKIETARPVIIAITSESPEASRRTAGGVIKKLIAQSTAFHAISLASATGSGQAGAVDPNFEASSRRLRGMIAAGEGDRERTQALQQGTATTGGGWQRLTSPLALDQALRRLAQELAGGYKVTFAREGSRQVRDLQVGILLDGATIRATAAPFGTR